jgi:hypothetical protein
MRCGWVIIICVLLVSCKKDNPQPTKPQWGPEETKVVKSTNPTPTDTVSIQLDARLSIDKNGYYHLKLNPYTNQTTHRITGKVTPAVTPIKVEWQSNLYWWLLAGDTVARVTKTYINQYSGELTYVNLPPIMNWKSQLVPTINSSSYSGTAGEINTVIAPIYKMKGDTLNIICRQSGSSKYKQLNIVLE